MSPQGASVTAEKTLGDLVSALRQALEHPEDLNLLGAGFWIDHVKQEHGDVWDEVMTWPLDAANVLTLAGPLTDVIQYEIGGRSDQESYDDARNRGHAFLKLIHAKARELGVDVPLEQIDVPLTPSETMEQAGMVKIVDGRVHLTEEGLAAAHEVQGQIDAHKE
jgi:hypothetical protein